ncbi:MAG: signal peptidase I [Lysinibacillus sp.]
MEQDIKDRKKSGLFSYIKLVIITFLIVFGCKQFLFAPIKVLGASMYPSYEDKDVIIVSKLSKIERFDQIVFQSPTEDALYIKRVIGLPGDTIEMIDDILYVNDVAYDEGYVNRKTEEENQLRTTENFTLEELVGSSTVPANHYFVLGDNRLKSFDSRHYGFITEDAVFGESKMTVFPFEHFTSNGK